MRRNFQTTTTFNAGASGLFTVPQGVYLLLITAAGGGGAGGYAEGPNSAGIIGGGGGGGACAKDFIYRVYPGQTISYSVGTRGYITDNFPGSIKIEGTDTVFGALTLGHGLCGNNTQDDGNANPGAGGSVTFNSLANTGAGETEGGYSSTGSYALTGPSSIGADALTTAFTRNSDGLASLYTGGAGDSQDSAGFGGASYSNGGISGYNQGAGGGSLGVGNGVGAGGIVGYGGGGSGCYDSSYYDGANSIAGDGILIVTCLYATFYDEIKYGYYDDAPGFYNMEVPGSFTETDVIIGYEDLYYIGYTLTNKGAASHKLYSNQNVRLGYNGAEQQLSWPMNNVKIRDLAGIYGSSTTEPIYLNGYCNSLFLNVNCLISTINGSEFNGQIPLTVEWSFTVSGVSKTHITKHIVNATPFDYTLMGGASSIEPFTNIISTVFVPHDMQSLNSVKLSFDVSALENGDTILLEHPSYGRNIIGQEFYIDIYLMASSLDPTIEDTACSIIIRSNSRRALVTACAPGGSGANGSLFSGTTAQGGGGGGGGGACYYAPIIASPGFGIYLSKGWPSSATTVYSTGYSDNNNIKYTKIVLNKGTDGVGSYFVKTRGGNGGSAVYTDINGIDHTSEGGVGGYNNSDGTGASAVSPAFTKGVLSSPAVSVISGGGGGGDGLGAFSTIEAGASFMAAGGENGYDGSEGGIPGGGGGGSLSLGFRGGTPLDGPGGAGMGSDEAEGAGGGGGASLFGVGMGGGINSLLLIIPMFKVCNAVQSPVGIGIAEYIRTAGVIAGIPNNRIRKIAGVSPRNLEREELY